MSGDRIRDARQDKAHGTPLHFAKGGAVDCGCLETQSPSMCQYPMVKTKISTKFPLANPRIPLVKPKYRL
jgi:hypothetical protein